MFSGETGIGKSTLMDSLFKRTLEGKWLDFLTFTFFHFYVSKFSISPEIIYYESASGDPYKKLYHKVYQKSFKEGLLNYQTAFIWFTSRV